MPNQLPDLWLRRAQFYLSGRQCRELVFWSLLLIFLSLIGVVWTIYGVQPHKGAWHAVEQTVGILKQIHWAWSPEALPAIAGAWLYYRWARYERLHLDPTGIHYKSPFPAISSSIRPSWTLRWTELSSVTLRPIARSSPHYFLELVNLGRKEIHTINPADWIDPAEMACTASLFTGWKPIRLRPVNAQDRDKYLTVAVQSPLVRYVQARGVAVSIGETTRPIGYALEKNSRAYLLLCVFFAALGYWLLEVLVHQQTYIEGPPWSVFAVVGIATSVASSIWLLRGHVPRAESCVVGILVGAVLGIAMWPGILRLNQLTDTDGPRWFHYRALEFRTFRAIDQDVPDIRVTDNDDPYWRQFKPGALYDFRLYRGQLGFYQLDLRPVHQSIREFYQGKP